MDPEDAADTVDDLFDAHGVDGTYVAPDGDPDAAAGCRVMVWRPKADRMRGGTSMRGHGMDGMFGVADRALYALVRREQIAVPVSGGAFRLPATPRSPERLLQIGEDAPIAHDSQGLVWRCAVVDVDPG